MSATDSPALRLARRAWRLVHGDAGAALALVERAQQRAEADGDAAGLAWAMLVRGFHRLSFGAPALAESELGDAATRLAAQGDRGAELLAWAGQARAQWRQGRVAEAFSTLSALRDEGLLRLRHEQLGVLLNALAGCHSSRGESEQAFAFMVEALKHTGSRRGLGFDVALHCNLGHELIELGDPHEALRQVEQGLERSVGMQHGRMLTVLRVNRVICLTELGLAEQALPDIEAIAAAAPDPSGRGLVPMHFEALALGALRAGALELGAALIERAQPGLSDDQLELAQARALLALRRGNAVAGLAELDAHQDLLHAEGDARPSLRQRIAYTVLRAELLEANGESTFALLAWREARALQAERAARASAARRHASVLGAELLQLRLRLQEQGARRAQAERARAELAELNRALERKIAEVEGLQVQLREQATRDALTGLGNRRHLNETLPSLIALALREGSSLAVAVLDLDHFKRVNDVHGHPAGDQLLAAFGLLLREQLRSSDQAFRYGGEEFCLLLPRTSAVDAQAKVQSLLQLWKSREFRLDDGNCLERQSFSAGISDTRHAPASPAALLRAADQLLLLAKRSQRGSVLVPGALEVFYP